MRLELRASPDEIREKSGQLLERLGEMLSSEAPEISEMLEKALPQKERELKYPVLQELAARTRELYAHQMDLMIQEIGDTVIPGIGQEEEGEPLGKGLYIGPHGGKWADAAHTIHWTGDQPVSRQAPEPEAPKIDLYPESELKDKLIEIGDALYAMQHGMHNVIDDTGLNHYDFGYWHSVRGNISGMSKMLKKYKGQIASHFGAEVYLKCGLHQVEKAKTSNFTIQPQYHDTFGSLYLPLNGFLKNDFKEYCEVQKKYGGIYDGNKKAFAISKLKLASFDFAAYKQDMAKFGIEVADPIGAPPKVSGTAGGEALTGNKVEEYIKGINAHQVTDVIVVRQRPDGIFEFYAPYAPAFNNLFANKGGQISGITKYNPVTHARETFDLELTEEAIAKLTVLFPQWQIMTHGVKEARIKRDQEIAELQMPIPEVQAKIGPDLKLMSFQNECVRFLDKANGNALIGDEMGLGKTIQTLAWAAKNNKRVLVVCPKVVRRNWLEEAEKFFPGYFHGVELIAADLKKGKVPDLSGINIAAVNYESLSKFEETIAAAGFDTIVIDESHRMKNPKAQATQNIQKIGMGMKHHILLSGTAVKNKKEELFTQLEMVAPGKFSKNAIKTSPIGGLWMDMHDVYIARQKTAVLKDLPEKTTSIVKHPVPGLPDMGAQNTVGAISKLKAEIAKGKVPVTISMVQEILDTSDSKVIVFTDSVEAAKALQEKFGALAILNHGQLSDDEREANKKEFQKKDAAGNFISEKRVFVTTRQSMAVGATLTAADKVVFNDLPWTAADVRQAEDRAHRIGQKNAVNVYWMTAEGNLFDENVNDILRRKYELGQKLNQGKQLTASEMEWLSTPVSIEELIAQIHGKAAGPKGGGAAEEAAPQVPALADMAHPELAPNLPEPQTAGTEVLPGSATVVEVPWQEVPSASSGVDKPLTVEMLDKFYAQVIKESEPAPKPVSPPSKFVVDPAGIAESFNEAQKQTDAHVKGYSDKLDALPEGTAIHLGYGQSFTKTNIAGDPFWIWEGKGGKKKGYLASSEAFDQMGHKAADKAIAAMQEPAPEKAPEAVKPPAVQAPIDVPVPVPVPTLAPEHGAAPAQAFSGFIQKHGIKIKEHYGDPSKVMVKVPKHETDALAKLQEYGITEPTFEGGQYHLVAIDKQKVKDLLFAKSLGDFLELEDPEDEQLSLFKGGMFIGPRGGKWADPEHTIPWQEEGTGGGAGAPAGGQTVSGGDRTVSGGGAQAASAPPPQMGAPTPAAQIAPQMQTTPRAPQAGLTPPAGGDPLAYQVDPSVDADGDGVADAARVGLPGKTVAPPPTVPRLPNLTSEERAVEGRFADAFEADPAGMADAFYDVAEKNHFIFETDAAKSMMPEWTRPDLPPDEKGKPIHPERAQARALYNTALHQTANAVVKRAFMRRLDEIAKMPEGERKILVTSGGVAGGKGSALGARPELAQSVAATWDAAGEQNGTENPWLMEECEKRGIKPVFLFVAADPLATWPGAVDRAKSIGRMVDARLFADSYAHGAKNFSAFHAKNKDRASFVFAKAKKGDPVQFLDQMPPEALSMDAEVLYGQAMQYIQSKAAELPPHIVSGATAGSRIWGGA